MPKPEWMVESEGRLRIKFRRCVDCRHIGEPCGRTNYIAGKGRETMYQCALHPTVRFHSGTYACTDFEHR